MQQGIPVDSRGSTSNTKCGQLVSSSCSLQILFFMLMLCVCLHLGMFLVSGFPTLVLFYSGSNRSFVSLALIKKFSNALGTMEYPLEMEVVDDSSGIASRFHQGCVLNTFSERYSIDLVLIPL